MRTHTHSSEPLTYSSSRWKLVPRNHFVMYHATLDQFIMEPMRVNDDIDAIISASYCDACLNDRESERKKQQKVFDQTYVIDKRQAEHSRHTRNCTASGKAPTSSSATPESSPLSSSSTPGMPFVPELSITNGHAPIHAAHTSQLKHNTSQPENSMVNMPHREQQLQQRSEAEKAQAQARHRSARLTSNPRLRSNHIPRLFPDDSDDSDGALDNIFCSCCTYEAENSSKHVHVE
jgi:hypothetical protein